MPKPTIRIHNVETDEILDREMTDAEYTEYQKAQQEEKQRLAMEEEKIIQKAALITKLQAMGLTLNDLTALGL
jgi:hypothetical protein